MTTAIHANARTFDDPGMARIYARELLDSGYRQAPRGAELTPGHFQAAKQGTQTIVRHLDFKASSPEVAPTPQRPSPDPRASRLRQLRELQAVYREEEVVLKRRLEHVEQELRRVDGFIVAAEAMLAETTES